jgi:hypothetical protein
MELSCLVEDECQDIFIVGYRQDLLDDELSIANDTSALNGLVFLHLECFKGLGLSVCLRSVR